MSTTDQKREEFCTKLLSDYNEALSHSGISGKRVAERLMELSKIGITTEGGVRRIAFTPEERQAKNLVKVWMKEAGLVVREDGAGNVFGFFQGKKHRPIVLSGSHVDSVPNGGHFDGPLGVIAALEVAEAWKETKYKPDYSYEVVIFTDEEGARFNGGLTGSRAMTGDINLVNQKLLKDYDGKSFEEVIAEDGLTLKGFAEAKRDLTEIAAFVEVHIEQGKRLEKEDVPVGIVTGIAGPTWLNITFTGEAGHAGNTPMDDRKDALVAASEFITKVKEFPEQVSSSAVATVGKMEVYPNGVNVIPGKVALTVDIRDIFAHTKASLVQRISNEAEVIADRHKIQVEITETLDVSPVEVSEKMQEKAAKSIEKHLIPSLFLPSGAGHDAMVVGSHVPMAMLFTKSIAGISHNPKEWSTLNDCVSTIHVLKDFIEQLCQVEGD